MTIPDALDGLFAPLEAERTWVVGQLGQSLDGRIATTSGHSHYINGPEDIRRLHRLRAVSDAVVVGAGTVESDDPRLTVRHVEGTNPVRVVLDPRGRLSPEAMVFSDGAAATIRMVGDHATVSGAERGTDAGGVPVGAAPPPGAPAGHPVETVRLPAPDGRFAPSAVLAELRARGLHRILIEGGGRTVSAFLQAGELDRLHLSVAALILGSGRPSITLPEIDTLDEALRPEVRHYRVGTDLVFDVALR